MKRFFVLAAAFTIASTAAFAADPSSWSVDKAASKLSFTGSMNGQAFDGAFGSWDAQIAFDPANLPASHVTATIETGSARTGDQSRDESLPTSDWFSVKVFPKATFVSDKITADGAGHYVAQGNLTIRGISKPTNLPFTLAIDGGTARMSGSVPIDRSTFGVGAGQWKTGEAVALQVQVKVEITARRQ